MGKLIRPQLYCPCYHIMSSDDDQPIVMDLYVGFNFRNQIVVCVDLHDYDEPEYNCSTAAVVDIDDARVMARNNKVDYRRLPIFIGECMEGWSQITNATFTQVEDCFKEITECLLDEGCRFKIVRTYGKGGHTCMTP